MFRRKRNERSAWVGVVVKFGLKSKLACTMTFDFDKL